MSFWKQLNRIEDGQRAILDQLQQLRQEIKRMEDTQQELDTAIQTVVTDFATQLSAATQQIITAVQAKGGTDFTPEVTSLQTLDASINAMPQQIAAALAGQSSGSSTTTTATSSATEPKAS